MPNDDAARPARPLLAPTPRRHGPRRDHLDGATDRNGRFLDPGSAPHFWGQRLQPTAYKGGQLLVRPDHRGRLDPVVLKALRTAAQQEGWAVRVDAVDSELLALARKAKLGKDGGSPLVVRVVLERPVDDDQPRSSPDAWPVLQRYRTLVDATRRGAVQLQHLLTTAAAEGGGIRSNYYVAHGPQSNYYVAHGPKTNYYVAHGPRTGYYVAHDAGSDYYVAHAPQPGYYVAHDEGSPSAAATAEYAQPGWGGRMPVGWVGPRPPRLDDDQLGRRRRPVVAVLDTGTGIHPWLDDEVVDRAPRCGKLRIGLTDPGTDFERLGVVTGKETGSLDIEAGHGTFVAGLVHQRCPDATILSVRVVQPDGVIDEYDVVRALDMLWVRQALALEQGRSKDLVDIVSVSLGYYHEDPSDAFFDPVMLAPIRALSRLGVLVVVSAGNDATSRPIFPAAFAPHKTGLVKKTRSDEVPLVAVGALNPDKTIALFSNDGPWVRAWRPGAGIVSTVPTTFDGGRQSSSRVESDAGVRATIDPDNFGAGFATWSGTSFAAPILAGDLAARLLRQSGVSRKESGVAGRVRAGWRALRAEVPHLEEPR